MFMLLERHDALGRLSQLLEQVHSGPGRVAFVSGEAGIGKTSLLRAFTQSASSSAAPVSSALSYPCRFPQRGHSTSSVQPNHRPWQRLHQWPLS